MARAQRPQMAAERRTLSASCGRAALPRARPIAREADREANRPRGRVKLSDDPTAVIAKIATTRRDRCDDSGRP